MKDPLKHLWVIVNKHGLILEKGDLAAPYPRLYHGGGQDRVVPWSTHFSNRVSVRQQLQDIKREMTKEQRKSWGFKIKKYNLSEEKK